MPINCQSDDLDDFILTQSHVPWLAGIAQRIINFPCSTAYIPYVPQSLKIKPQSSLTSLHFSEKFVDYVSKKRNRFFLKLLSSITYKN
jgi:hypothetical protein